MKRINLDALTILQWMKEHFDVFPERGELVWIKPPRNHGRMNGRQAGSFQTARGKTYCHIKRNRVGIKRGWLIFLWVNGRWPSPCLDHIDGNSTNDAISNLREATITENAWNHRKRAKRSMLPMGIRQQNGKFIARIAYRGQQIYLGRHGTIEQAHSIYLKKRKELYGQFA